MIPAILVALAVAQSPTIPAPTMDGISSLGNPNYRPTSVHVQSVMNPTYSFPSGLSDQPVVNGRLYKGVPIIGGVDVGPKTELARAAAGYGAFGEENTRVQAQVQGLFRFHPTTAVEFSPWAPVPSQMNSPATDPFSRAQEKMARRAEDARQQWLKDNGYIGGVRTFVNDTELYPVPPEAKKTQLPEPRGVIQLAPDVPAFKARMHVQGTIHLSANLRTASLVKVVPPVGAKPEATKAQAVAKADEQPQIKPEIKVASK